MAVSVRIPTLYLAEGVVKSATPFGDTPLENLPRMDRASRCRPTILQTIVFVLLSGESSGHYQQSECLIRSTVVHRARARETAPSIGNWDQLPKSRDVEHAELIRRGLPHLLNQVPCTTTGRNDEVARNSDLQMGFRSRCVSGSSRKATWIDSKSFNRHPPTLLAQRTAFDSRGKLPRPSQHVDQAS